MIKPKALQKGDLIAIAAPASPFDRTELFAGTRILRRLGLEVTFRKDVFTKNRYLAGADSRRAEELNQFFLDPKIKAVFFARGGYGTQRILHLLDADAIKANPKVVMGYSDLTSLLAWLYRHGVGGIFYGPTIAKHFRYAPGKTLDIMLGAITSTAPLGRVPVGKAKVLKEGSAEGPLVGGCLSLITSSIGTSYDLNTEDSILLMEDVAEPVYKYDRMLTQLKSAGKLRGVKGIVFGSMTLAKGGNKTWLDKMLRDVLADFPGPIVTNFPCGHHDFKKLFVTLPLGVKARLATSPLALEFLEPALI